MDKTHSKNQYLRRGSILMLTTFALGFIMAYAFNVALSNMLGPVDYGDYKVAEAYIALGSLVVMMGGSRATASFLSKQINDGSGEGVWEYVRFYIVLSTVLSLVLLFLIYAVHHYHLSLFPEKEYHPLIIASLALPLVAMAALFGGILQLAKHLNLSFLPWRIGYPGLRLLLCGGFFLIFGSLDDFEAVALTLIAAFLIAVFCAYHTLRLGLMPLKRDKNFVKPIEWLKISTPMMMIIALQTFMRQVDIYMIEFQLDEMSVGHYAAAMTSVSVINSVQSAIYGLIIPLIIPTLESGKAAIIQMNRKAFFILLKTVIPTFCLLGLFGTQLLSVFGNDVENTYICLMTLAAGFCIYGINSASVLWLQYSGQERWLMYNLMITLGINATLNYILIPRMGIEGAAIATSLSLIISTIIVVVKLKMHLGFFPWTSPEEKGEVESA
ncbi:hypothetical protein D5018_03175 [Parashewanella curva]|uniref:Uncharacterized protein n=1 Tax=Parashewanella curva TaxID=2338552 RepID=A0A3L8Q115_9GAMM|nr:polysaccharide biosynthesis C-terminal domain-containing protein [Parashewanella curva]RLV61275.1 hypothetical protein D5018_03175 [Parashewanella curva]